MIIGFDTGANGASVAMNRSGGVISAFDFSAHNAAEFASWIRAIVACGVLADDDLAAYIERVDFGAFSRGGKASIATQAAFYAGPQWVLDAYDIETHLVGAREWQSMFPDLPHGEGEKAYAARKRAIRDAVAELMRDRECACKITLGRCDAIAIAEWGRLRGIG